MDDITTGYRVRLVSVASFYKANTSLELEQVIFKVTPELTETHRAEYTPVQPVHMPGSIQVYKGSPSREFSISAKLVSRTAAEATENMESLQLLRGWLKPYFGDSSTLTAEQRSYRAAQNRPDSPRSQDLPANRRAASGVELLGAPPDVLYLYGYSSVDQRAAITDRSAMSGQRAINIHKVPVVMTSLDITFPSNVDYIPSDESAGISSPFPVLMEVRMNVVETHSPAEYQRFNLSDYKTGRMVSF